MVTPAGTDDTLTVTNGKVNDYIFRSTFQDSYQGKVLANYTTNELKAKKVVLYYDNSSDYAKGIAKSFEKTYTGKIVDKVSFQSGDKDFQATLSKIKSEDYDAIVMPGYYNETGLITKQARELGIEQPILGGDKLLTQPSSHLRVMLQRQTSTTSQGIRLKHSLMKQQRNLSQLTKLNINLSHQCLTHLLMMRFTW